ncbi:MULTISPECIES: thiamine ABC transporter substrate binding subunit [Pasteurellaceae]|uniref:Thiamine-binding periplasmic protein n=1 Tax=Pasteurella atlantica TaxID=2827233 RepID=A0AAW8CQK8_9PAST|nr:thiamine ABC transporter substrate binding subunit [Pasteurella atlantica]MBR0572741.1 thiamine ABC transporter substrate binding subunit [Pasteurella atlantica]MDP8040460.1 thiamine ABC transporter substrate binding subunit [Pasteurella atlantica]MDP8042611.1 thiamine ABC transporter substrate binding subunit [Pasteurella atlantica]MDP8044714.1 thiamine ABC transporter substrate binding subunit [Pasteurella atlantica]MDP8046762.1 thiamine ABC transporter substrate binding subunit [Pasteure
MKHHQLVILSTLVLSTTVLANTPTLTVYTYDSFTAEWGAAPVLTPFFEKECGCNLKFMPFQDGITMFNRIRLEGKKTKADVMLGLDNFSLQEAEKSNLFAKHQLKIVDLNLPQQWTNDTFYPYDFGEFAFVYNKQKLKTPPKSLAELVNRQDIKIIYQDPRTSTVGRGLLVWMNSVYGDKVKTAWQNLANHTVTIGKGWSETYGAFLKGESDMVLSYSTSPLYHHWYDKNDDYVAADFSEGHLSQIEVAAILKSSKQQKLARQFLAFLHKKEVQKVIATHNIMKPVIVDYIDPAFATMPVYKALNVSLPNVDTLRKWQAEWQSAVAN